ncbi:MAG TPA: hypothetical protein VIG70_05655 [Burkholderiales bacterium]|jgi:hypothetical protein
MRSDRFRFGLRPDYRSGIQAFTAGVDKVDLRAVVGAQRFESVLAHAEDFLLA